MTNRDQPRPRVARPLSPAAATYAAAMVKAADDRMRRLVEVQKATTPRPVRKAAQDPVLAVYDARGNLVGIVDPDVVRPVVQPPAPKPSAGPAEPPAVGDALPDTPDPAATPAGVDLDPAPPASVGTAADAVTKAALADIDQVTAVLKQRVAEGTPTEQQRAHEALQLLAINRFQQIRKSGGQPLMPR